MMRIHNNSLSQSFHIIKLQHPEENIFKHQKYRPHCIQILHCP